MRRLVVAAIVFSFAVPARAQNVPWHGYGGDAQHNAQAPAAGQPLVRVHWSIPVDVAPPSFLGIHYASPMITATNTVLVPVKLDANGTYRMEARAGATGQLLWSKTVHYRFPPYKWVPSIPAHLTEQNRLYFAGPGGTLRFRNAPDTPGGTNGLAVFYGRANYRADRAAYHRNVMVSTPPTADAAGNVFFGFRVTGPTPLNLKSGIARIDAAGHGRWISAGDAAQDQNMTEVPLNCAPAISRDGSTVYIAVSNGHDGYLVGLDSRTLQPKYRAALIDPNSGTAADVSDYSSASPTIGPDGDVYYGVLEYNDTSHNDRGWLLHFDSTLVTQKIPGSFGWDNTVAIVPSTIVPSYSGSSSYLLMSKYNNYIDIGNGDGHNKVAVLDPNGTEADPVIPTVTVMKEVLTKRGPTHEPGERRGVVYEWCINSAVVDVANKSVIVNSEDGHTYRWDLKHNALIQPVNLNVPTSEAYTPTLIGPDGTVYSINDARLYALGN
jgi:hypothetical protein